MSPSIFLGAFLHLLSFPTNLVLACAETGIMLALEIQEGKEGMAMKAHAAEFGSGTSSVLRLTAKYIGRARTVCGDSAFASASLDCCSAAASTQDVIHGPS